MLLIYLENGCICWSWSWWLLFDGLYILSLKHGGIIEGQLTRSGALLVGVGIGVVGAVFLEDIAIAVASSITGALAIVIGADCYLNTGFRAQIWDQAIKVTFSLPEINSSMYFMFAGTVGLAVFGVVIQLLTPTKGFGRDN